MEVSIDLQNLKGQTRGEKRRELFLLLDRYKSSDDAIVDSVIRSIVPRDSKEALFKAEVVLYFRKIEVLLEFLYNEHKAVSKKILRNPWFYQNDYFNKCSASEIVENILSKFCFIDRNMFIKRFAFYHKNEPKLDAMFDLVLKKYGLCIAKPILCGCSDEKIRYVFFKYDLKLNTREKLILLRRNFDFYQLFIDKNMQLFEDEKLVSYILYKCPELYFKNKNELQGCKVGKALTRKLLNYDKEIIISHASEFLSKLHLKTVYKVLGPETAKRFFRGIFPDKPNWYSHRAILNFLNMYPKNCRFQVYSEVFSEKYNIPLSDCPTAMEEDVYLEYITDLELRNYWVTEKIKMEALDFRLLHFYTTDISIPMIKEKINLTSKVTDREALISNLVKTCKFNNDLASLLDVLKYFCARHRNDDVVVWSEFLEQLSNSFDLSTLDEEYWKYILEVISIFKLKGQFSYRLKFILIKHIEFLWRNERPFKETLDLYMKQDSITDTDCLSDVNSPTLKKLLLTEFIEYEHKQNNTEEKQRECDVNFALWIVTKGERENISMSDYPALVAPVISDVEEKIKTDKYHWYINTFFKYFFFNKNNLEMTNIFVSLYLEYGLNKYFDLKCILHCLKNYTSQALKMESTVIKQLFSKRPSWDAEKLSNIMQIFRYFAEINYSNFSENLIEFCLENYKNEKIYNTDHMIMTLAIFMEPKAFAEFAAMYKPSAVRMETDHRDDHFIKMKRNIVAKSFKYVNSLSAVIDILLSYCENNDPGEALVSLHALIQYCPEVKLLEITNKLMLQDKMIYKKQSVIISCLFTNVSNAMNMIGMIQKESLSATAAYKIYFVTINCLRKHQHDEFFEMLQKQVSRLNVAFLCALDNIIKFELIPQPYRSKYFILIINILEENKDKQKELPKYANKLLSNVDEKLMEKLPYDFCNNMISKYYLKCGSLFGDTINEFSWNFILYCEYDFVQKCEFIFNKIKESREANMTSEALKKSVYYFLDKIAAHILVLDVSVVRQLFLILEITFKEIDCIDIFINFKTVILHKEANNELEFCKKFTLLLEEYSNNYGPHFASIFANCIQLIFQASQILMFCQNLYQLDNSLNNCLLILDLLRYCNEDECSKDKFKLLEQLTNHDNQIVKRKAYISYCC